MIVTVATANIGRNQKSIEATKSDFKKLHEMLPKAIIGFQEIDEADNADEHRILKEVFGKTHHIVGFGTKVPVAVPKTYKISDADIIFGTSGIPHVSPTRKITKFEFSSVLNPRAFRCGFYNGHTPAGGFNSKKNERAEKERVDGWWNVVKKYKDIATAFVRGRKVKVVFRTGDDNRMDMIKIHPDETPFFIPGIDNVSYIAVNATVKVISKNEIKLNSDHNAKVAKVKITRKKKNGKV